MNGAQLEDPVAWSWNPGAGRVALAGAVLTEEKEAAVDDGLAAGAGEIGRGGDAAEENEEVPEGVETFVEGAVRHGEGWGGWYRRFFIVLER
ncbi:MAG: hypothetical protein WCA37_10500 [Terracidiphilus sp.]